MLCPSPLLLFICFVHLPLPFRQPHDRIPPLPGTSIFISRGLPPPFLKYIIIFGYYILSPYKVLYINLNNLPPPLLPQCIASLRVFLGLTTLKYNSYPNNRSNIGDYFSILQSLRSLNKWMDATNLKPSITITVILLPTPTQYYIDTAPTYSFCVTHRTKVTHGDIKANYLYHSIRVNFI